MQIRTRIAPSPTGAPHVGTAYIALFNRCFARSQGGRFILRIEDTDRARSTAAAEAAILDALRWLGLDWDEGPDKNGSCGPYRQSERGAIYREHIDKLVEKGDAFPCFCDAQRLATVRQQQMEAKQQPGYDGHCLSLSQDEAAARIKAGEPHVLRLKVPEGGTSAFHDMLRGEVSIDWSQVDMQVLMKSDGSPTYHFANVVDDHLMGISHVIRGEEWISSIPKHLLLYQAFGWTPPVFCHMPLLRNPNKSKLSKRRNPTAIDYYRDMGYLPQALVNYLGMMGWSMPSGEEKFNLQQMTDAFDISRVSLGGPVFDIAKLNWLNGRYLRENLSPEEFATAYTQWAFPPEKVRRLAPLLQQRAERFCDVATIGAHFLTGQPDLSPDAFASLIAKKAGKGVEGRKGEKTDADADAAADDIKRILQFTLWRLEALPDFSAEAVESCLKQLANDMDLKIRDYLAPLFIAISGRPASVSVMASITLLGPHLTRARLRQALTHLGGLSKTQAKTLEKAYNALEKP